MTKRFLSQFKALGRTYVHCDYIGLPVLFHSTCESSSGQVLYRIYPCGSLHDRQGVVGAFLCGDDGVWFLGYASGVGVSTHTTDRNKAEVMIFKFLLADDSDNLSVLK